MHSLDVPADVGLPLAAVVAMGTLEARLLAALVAQVPLQRALPHEDAGAVRALKLLVASTGIDGAHPLNASRIDNCEHRKQIRPVILEAGRSGTVLNNRSTRLSG